MRWDKVPKLEEFDFLVAYGDPSPSNKESKNKSFKSLVLLGCKGGVFYVITCFLSQTATNSVFVDWFYEISKFVGGRAVVYYYIENNTLQDPFYQQVFVPLFVAKGEEKGHHLFVIPDVRKKPDKFTRIEGTLEPINEHGKLIFNAKEKNNPHMTALEGQFIAITPQLEAPADGPDAVEGGVWVINNKVVAMQPPLTTSRKNYKNSNRF